MLAKTLIFATLAALAVAAPAPSPYGRHREGGHRNHKWGNHGKNKWNNNDNNDDSSNDWSPSTGSSNDNSDSSSSNEWSESKTQTSDNSEQTGSQEESGSSSQGQVDSGSAVTGGYSSIASYYDITNPEENEGESAGSVACSGAKYANSDAIVAIASQQYNSGVCGKRVRITDTKTGNTAEATIVDECMSCQDNQLDLTPSLWAQLHGQSTENNNHDGVFDIKWEYVN
jgi:hypothetical protein